MKRKFSKILGVGLTLALLASLLMTAAPVAADVSSVTVDNVPQTAGRAAEYTIDFTTTAALFLDGPSTITITFHADTTVPGTDIAAAKVTVNDTACTVDAVTTDQVVVISVPKDIAAGPVEVVIAADSGILNPDSVATDWTLEVKTSAETTVLIRQHTAQLPSWHLLSSVLSAPLTRTATTPLLSPSPRR